jgi:hypothetical protein
MGEAIYQQFGMRLRMAFHELNSSQCHTRPKLSFCVVPVHILFSWGLVGNAGEQFLQFDQAFQAAYEGSIPLTHWMPSQAFAAVCNIAVDARFLERSPPSLGWLCAVAVARAHPQTKSTNHDLKQSKG